jgi:hypothetical protein
LVELPGRAASKRRRLVVKSVHPAGCQLFSIMSNEYALWKQDLRRAIGGLRELTVQAGAGGEAAGSSFQQAMNYLYQACQFPAFVALDAWRQAGLDAVAGAELVDFKHRLDAYDEPESDAAILADPHWHDLLRQAVRVQALLA